MAEEQYDYLANLDAPSRVLDLGAWKGRWTIAMRKHWPDAHFTCVEAGKIYKHYLHKFADKHHIAVLGNENRPVEFFLREVNYGSWSKVQYTKGSNIFGATPSFKCTAHEVRDMQTLDRVVGKDAEYDFIKQDLQGAEILVMQGAPQIFQRAKHVLNEVNLYKDPAQPLIPDVDEMDRYMETIGFGKGVVIEDHGKNNQIDKLYSRL
jgi:FkbM family methyltransferase